MQEVRVGVGVLAVEVCRIIGVGVKGIGRTVGVTGFVAMVWVTTFTGETVDSRVAMNVGETFPWGRVTEPQAGKRINTKRATIRLLSTLAVYHKIHLGYLILSPCEYVPARVQIHSFAGKIA
jgi:hypothetical protein